ncbi:MAG TPA: hypothetical protein VE999_06020 [Gemmataceae bacterium]|nr:hypothetical protein [Gemmataceae bacterium]
MRAKNYETANFMDVAEADATVAFSGSVTGGTSNIGARAGTSGATLAGQVGAVAGTVGYGDQALVRYTPVTGFPLIQQVSSPIAPESIVHMFDSDFPLGSILEMSVDRLTPGFADNYLAQDRIVLLDQYGAMVLSSQQTGPQKPRGRESSSENQELNLVLHNKALAPTASFTQCDVPDASADPGVNVTRLWTGLSSLYGISPSARLISLAGNAHGGYFFRTRSAIGALKLAETPEIFIATPEQADEIIAANLAAPCRVGGGGHLANLFYFNEPGEGAQDSIDADWRNFLAQALETRIDNRLRQDTLNRDDRRIFILIERSSAPPSNAYVAIARGPYWYSIRLDDETSKANFALLNEILTIQAVPEQTPKLTPSINVSP